MRNIETAERLTKVVFTRGKIREKIKGLKTNSATGPDGISVKLLQTACEELLEPLLILYESSLNSGTVPSVWKRAVVTPIFKKGKKG